MTRTRLNPDITRRNLAPYRMAAKVWTILCFGFGAAIAGGFKECDRQQKAPEPPPTQIIIYIT